jgi:hypothetical protein
MSKLQFLLIEQGAVKFETTVPNDCACIAVNLGLFEHLWHCDSNGSRDPAALIVLVDVALERVAQNSAIYQHPDYEAMLPHFVEKITAIRNACAENQNAKIFVDRDAQ